MFRLFPHARRASLGAFALAFVLVDPAGAQAPAAEAPAPDITVTADRTPTAAQRTGSAVTVVRADEIAKRNPGSLVDALRTVPGLDVTETGGPGATTTVRIRGAESGQTLVLIDGVRVNDPGAASGEFDFSLLPPALIDRIEVLRGPQSALYGSDAMGGVVNILTRRPRGRFEATAGVEAGSFGTASATAGFGGSNGPWSYLTSGLAQRSDGFSRFGHRIGRLGRANNIEGIPGGPLEKDGYERLAGFGRLGYDAGTGVRFDASVLSAVTAQDYDAAFGTFPDTPAFARRVFNGATGRMEVDALDGQLLHSLQIFANQTDRTFRDVTLGRVRGQLRETSRSLTDFVGERRGAEYQGTLKLGAWGSVIAGGRFERETADSFTTGVVPLATPKARTIAADQSTASAFALWQLPVGERLTLTLGGRHDQVSDVGGFPTWRATAAYRVPETGTKFRASAGTGAKAPTLFQRFSPEFGSATLEPERSLGVDAGIDQEVAGGRGTLSVTVFANRFRNLIAFESGPRCLQTQAFGCYVNVGRASTSGVETSARAVLVPGFVSTSATYTYLEAKDDTTGLDLARRPRHVGRLAVQVTPATGWLVEPSLVMVSERFSSSGERNRLAPYARLDVYAERRFDETWKAHLRFENLTNARYQEVFNFGTAGRAVYGGVTATW